MAARPGVATLQLDKSDGAYFFWIALLKRFVSAEFIFDASTTTVVLWTFEDYSLADHQFIQLKINSPESPQTSLTVLIPRKFVMFVSEGKNFDAVFGFTAGLKEEKSMQSSKRVL